MDDTRARLEARKDVTKRAATEALDCAFERGGARGAAAVAAAIEAVTGIARATQTGEFREEVMANYFGALKDVVLEFQRTTLGPSGELHERIEAIAANPHRVIQGLDEGIRNVTGGTVGKPIERSYSDYNL